MNILSKSINGGKKLTLLSFGVLAAGCANMQETTEIANQNFKKTQTLSDASNLQTTNPFIQYNDKIFIADQGYKIVPETMNLPDIFNQNFVFSSNLPLTLDVIVNDIMEQTNLTIRISDDAIKYMTERGKDLEGNQTNLQSMPYGSGIPVVSKNKLMKTPSFYFTGEFKELLNRISSYFGLWWVYNSKDNTINIYRYESKTFTMDMLLGYGRTKKTIKNTSQTDNLMPQSVEVTYDSGEENRWDSAIKAIQVIIGSDGSAELSSSNGYITVKTTPRLMRFVEEYIEELNRKARQRIAIKVDIYDVQQKADSNYGLNWDVVYETTKGSLNWDTTGIPIALGNSDIKLGTVTGSIGSGPFKGTKAILSALQQVGKTTYVKGQTAYTVNGNPTALNIGQSVGYVKERKVTSTSNTGTTEVSLTPGTINTGFYLTFNPKIIKGNEVLLDFTVDMSSLIEIRRASAGDSSIELPSVESKTFMQALPLVSGQSFILAGFKDEANQYRTNSLAGEDVWALGGSKGTQKAHTMTVIIVTPYIIGSN